MLCIYKRVSPSRIIIYTPNNKVLKNMEQKLKTLKEK